jgi:predicted Fe-Mo cluster-binding NifX family protein
MKVCVIAEGDSLDSYVADDFGRAPFFLIVDADTMGYRAVENEFANSLGPGMKVAEAIAKMGVDAVITGGIGPHGIEILEKAGIHVAYDEEGTAEECIADLKRRFEKRRSYSD